MNNDPEALEHWVRDVHDLELGADLLADPIDAARRIARIARDAAQSLNVQATPGDFDLLHKALAEHPDEY